VNMHSLLLLQWINDQVLRQRNCGYGILVSQVPKETEAIYSLRTPSEVKTHFNLKLYFLHSCWLTQLIDLSVSLAESSCRWWNSSILWWDGRNNHHEWMIKNDSSVTTHQFSQAEMTVAIKHFLPGRIFHSAGGG
jgi:hypothetical protein